VSDTPPREPFDHAPDWYGQKEKRKRAEENACLPYSVSVASVIGLVVIVLIAFSPQKQEVPSSGGRIANTVFYSAPYLTVAALVNRDEALKRAATPSYERTPQKVTPARYRD